MVNSVRLRGAGPALGLVLACFAYCPAYAFPHSPYPADSPSLLLAAADTSAAAPTTDEQVHAPAANQGPSPGTASGLAFFPGVLAHGTGHFYAGRPVTGALLVVAEALGVYLAYTGAMDIRRGLEAFDPDDPTFEGDTGTLSQGIGLAAGGAMIFLTSWFFDLSGAPIAAGEEAAKRQAAATAGRTQVRPALTPGGVAVVLERTF